MKFKEAQKSPDNEFTRFAQDSSILRKKKKGKIKILSLVRLS